MNDPLHEEQLTSEPVFQGRLLNVFRDEVRLPDGKSGVREYIKHPGAVVVIPVCDDGRLIFERQFRYPLHRPFLELGRPASSIRTRTSWPARGANCRRKPATRATTGVIWA